MARGGGLGGRSKFYQRPIHSEILNVSAVECPYLADMNLQMIIHHYHPINNISHHDYLKFLLNIHPDVIHHQY